MANENQKSTNRKPRGRAVMSILRDIEKAKQTIAKAQDAENRLTELEAELEAVPQERRERELANAQTAVNLLSNDTSENTEQTEDSVSSS